MLSSVTQFRGAWVPSLHPGRALYMGGEACVKLGALQVPPGQMAGSPVCGGEAETGCEEESTPWGSEHDFSDLLCDLRSLHISEPRFLPTPTTPPTTLQGCGEAPGRQSMYENTWHTGRVVCRPRSTRARGACVLGLPRRFGLPAAALPPMKAWSVPGTEERLGRNTVMQGGHHPQTTSAPSKGTSQGLGLGSASTSLHADRWPIVSLCDAA